MKISITFTHTQEEDGFDGQTGAVRDNVIDLYEAAQVLTDAFRGAGFSYVVNVGFEKDDGEVVFGQF
jgi:hypothetical protein